MTFSIGCQRKDKFSDTYTPQRVSGIPKEAFWVGGADGGKWYLIVSINKEVHATHLKIYHDYTGELEVNKQFTLHCHTDSILTLQDLKNYIDGFDGNRVYLSITNQDNEYCYLK
jgi:hypothetical protein